MNLVMQIFIALGVGMVVYAIFGILTSEAFKVKLPPLAAPHEDIGKEQKIQRLQQRLLELEEKLKQSAEEYAKEESAFNQAKANESKLTDELRRRNEWVAKAEAELNKIKLENSDLNNKFISKQKELEAEFTHNVDLTRQINIAKLALIEHEKELRLKEDQIQAQAHQLQEQFKTIKEQASGLAEFSRKEKISEWVPKSEFIQLNAEYSKLEDEFEANAEKLKSFSEEIAHLRQEVKTKIAAPEVKIQGGNIPEKILTETVKDEEGKGDVPA